MRDDPWSLLKTHQAGGHCGLNLRLNAIPNSPRKRNQELQTLAHSHFWWPLHSTIEHLFFHKMAQVVVGSYLHQRMPVCDGLPRIRQHFAPVVSAKPLSFVAYLTHADDLIVTYTVKMAHNSFFLKFWSVRATVTQTNRGIREGSGSFHSLI